MRIVRTEPPRATEIDAHPVFQVLPPETQRRIEAEGVLRRLPAGSDVLHEAGNLHFMLSGVLGLFPAGSPVCVSVVVAGAVYGWDRMLDPSAAGTPARPLLDCVVYSVEAAAVLDTLGRDWLTRLVAAQMSRKLRMMEAEAACNARHLLPQRLAKWLVRLHCGANGAPLQLTQADLGGMLGVQRTSVNAVAKQLQSQGLARFGRARVQILNLEGLRAVSCGCGDASPPAASNPVRLTPSPALSATAPR